MASLDWFFSRSASQGGGEEEKKKSGGAQFLRLFICPLDLAGVYEIYPEAKGKLRATRLIYIAGVYFFLSARPGLAHFFFSKNFRLHKPPAGHK